MSNNLRRPITAIVMPSIHYSGRNDDTSREIYMAFTQSLRDTQNQSLERRILCAIHKAADRTGHSDAYITRVLVDMGLRAPRLALPSDFLDHADSNLLATHRFPIPLPESYRDLATHWGALGEDSYGTSTSSILH